ncbi:hypothetical protein OC846_006061 [Tilletia horrida]|uniref:Cyclin N-terminal domain-containing protein n=1 Tax=Tilletia horrida TaxID=155126 RepID=A0AAN6GJK0_9BASI|nr:hypothetical protein OC846_006061 [Tilletia horrida]KAK0560599.1 hypothetical protein OC861_006212 [Tilletia horrida]
MAAVLPPPVLDIAATAPPTSSMLGVPQDYPFAFVARLPGATGGALHFSSPDYAAPRFGGHGFGSMRSQGASASISAAAGMPYNPYAVQSTSSSDHAPQSALRSAPLGDSGGPKYPQPVAPFSIPSSSSANLGPSQNSNPASQTISQYTMGPRYDAQQHTQLDLPAPTSHDHIPYTEQGQIADQTRNNHLVCVPTPLQAPDPAPAEVQPPAAAAPARAKPSADRIAKFFANLACYIWFASGLPDTSPLATPSHSPGATHTPLLSSPLRNSTTASHQRIAAPVRSGPTTAAGPTSILPTDDFADRLSKAMERVSMAAEATVDEAGTGTSMYARQQGSLRMQPSNSFVAFIKNLLSTTQVSSSVIILALLYIFRLKSRHPELHGQEGSEYRLSVTSLMLANKWLDDHTYLNKTWSELSGIELRDVTKMEREFWSGLGMDISVSDIEFQKWLQKVENMHARREIKIQRRALDIRARQLYQRRARELVRVGSISPSRKLPSRTIDSRQYAPTHHEDGDATYVPQNSPTEQWRATHGYESTVNQELYPRQQTSRAALTGRDNIDNFGDMLGSRRLPLPHPSLHPESSGRDRIVPRRLFDSRPSSTSSSTGSFAALHQSFKGLSTHSPNALGTHDREEDAVLHRANKRFAADPEWSEPNPFMFAPPLPAPASQLPQMYAVNSHAYSSPPRQIAVPADRSRGPRSIPAHEVHQSHPNYFGYEGTGQSLQEPLGPYAESLVAPFQGYDAASVAAESAPALAWYEVRSGPRTVHSTTEAAPFFTHPGYDAWETFNQAAHRSTAQAPGYSYIQGSPEYPWDMFRQSTANQGGPSQQPDPAAYRNHSIDASLLPNEYADAAFGTLPVVPDNNTYTQAAFVDPRLGDYGTTNAFAQALSYAENQQDSYLPQQEQQQQDGHKYAQSPYYPQQHHELEANVPSRSRNASVQYQLDPLYHQVHWPTVSADTSTYRQ